MLSCRCAFAGSSFCTAEAFLQLRRCLPVPSFTTMARIGTWTSFCRAHGHTSAGHSRWLNALTDYQFQPSETLYIMIWRRLWCNRDRTNENKICTTTGLRGATCYLRSELAAEKILELRTKVLILHPISLVKELT